MSLVFLKLYGDPIAIFYLDAKPGTDYPEYPLMISCEDLREEVKVFGGGANSNVSVVLSNKRQQLTGLFSLPPILRRAELVTDDEIFSGVVSQITFDGDTCTLSLEA